MLLSGAVHQIIIDPLRLVGRMSLEIHLETPISRPNVQLKQITQNGGH